jgi:hypothetical protein
MLSMQVLKEREKELRCLYSIHDILSRRDRSPVETFLSVLDAIPAGWQRPEATGARIEYLGRNYVGPGHSPFGSTMREPIRVGGVDVGSIEVNVAASQDDETPFLDEERALLRNIAHRLAEYLEWKQTELLGTRAASKDIHWMWRTKCAEALAASLDADRFGVSEVYLAGSAETGDARAVSDIDLIVVSHGTDEQRTQLSSWLEGWSLCLAEIALQQTGHEFPDGILNIQWTTQPPSRLHRPDARRLQLKTKT